MADRKLYGGSLSNADLVTLRAVRLRASVANSGNSNMSVDEAMEAFDADIRLIAELRERYEIPEDESVGFSLIDGAIIDVDEEQ